MTSLGGRGRACLVLCGLALLLACAQGGGSEARVVSLEPLEGPLPATAAVPRVVVLVSVAGFTPEAYRGSSPSMRTVALLARAGVAADAVRSVAPAAPYPAHATLVTGRRPSEHGIVADRRIGEHGVGPSYYSDAKDLTSPALWQLVSRGGGTVASFGWPTTRGGTISVNIPDVEAGDDGSSWLAALAATTDARSLALVQAAGGRQADAQRPGAARDAVFIRVACGVLASDAPPRLLLLRLSQTAVAQAQYGVGSSESRRAFAETDTAISSLLGCARSVGRLADGAFVVVGDHGALPVHTVVSPNHVLAEAGLLTPRTKAGDLLSWTAIARSNGGSAFVYAKAGRDAVLARRALEAAARRTGSFRVVSAEEMLRDGADPKAWFGLEAEPGFVFGEMSDPPLLRTARARASWGYLPDRPEMDAGFVAWGAGFRSQLRIPEMRQTDVAPTLAPLLGVSFEESDGRELVGVLSLPQVAAPREH